MHGFMHLGNWENSVVGIEQGDLRTHCVVVGPTGSGKTGLLVNLIEEWKGGVVILDSKGEMTNLAVQNAEYCVVDPRGVDVSVEDVDTTLRAMGVWTKHGALLCDAIRRALVEVGRDASVGGWVRLLTDPPATVGGVDVDVVCPRRERERIARAILCRSSGVARVDLSKRTILTMRHMSFDEQVTFQALVLTQIAERMRVSRNMEVLVVIDEARGLIPPVRVPATKGVIELILAQGRAWGLCLVLGTQHPVDLDHRALSNVGTWMVGPLKKGDLSRDFDHPVLGLGKRQFVVSQGGGHRRMVTRDTKCRLVGPLGVDDFCAVAPAVAVARVVVAVARRKGGLEGMKWLRKAFRGRIL